MVLSTSHSRLIGLSLLLSFAVTEPAHGERKLVIVASIYPLAAVAREIATPDSRVVSLLTPGANPHAFEATPSQVWAAAEASLIVRIGLGFDDWVLRALEGANPPPPSVVASQGVELLPLVEEEHFTHQGEETWDP